MTKAELLEQLQSLRSANAELIAQLEERKANERNILSQIVWLERELDTSYPGVLTTTSSGTLRLRFSGRYSGYNKQTSKRSYGPRKRFCVYGEEAVQAVLEIFEGEDRLAMIKAFESPYLDGSSRSEWRVTDIALVPRTESAAPVQQAPAFSQEPTREPVHF